MYKKTDIIKVDVTIYNRWQKGKSNLKTEGNVNMEKLKKVMAIFILTLMVMSTMTGTAQAANTIVTVQIDGKVINFEVPAHIVNGRTMGPM